MVRTVKAFAPGRVNLIGDHTDYSGGLVLPLAVQLGTSVMLEPGGDSVRLFSSEDPDRADVPLDVADPAVTEPAWARYVAGVVAEIRPTRGGTGEVITTLPIGAGLSSSAALEVAVALALGFAGRPLDLALACQRAEQRSSGVPCGLMDQLTSVAGVAGHALSIDCTTNSVQPVPVPPGCEIVAVPCGASRRLAGSAYAERRAACERAISIVGPLRQASIANLDVIDDPVVKRRARHVVTENARVVACAAHLGRGDLGAVGAAMVDSHASLRDDFEVSTPALDRLVEELISRPGVYGARLTGGGFGGCVVALTEPGAVDLGWKLQPSGGAWVEKA
jgi:galactokinase